MPINEFEILRFRVQQLQTRNAALIARIHRQLSALQIPEAAATAYSTWLKADNEAADE